MYCYCVCYIFDGLKDEQSKSPRGIFSGVSIKSGKLAPVLTISVEGCKLFKKNGLLRSKSKQFCEILCYKIYFTTQKSRKRCNWELS